MRPNQVTAAVTQYSELQSFLEDFRLRIHDIVTVALRDRVEVVEISSRVKAVDSFREKISRRDKNYTDPLSELTDLVGLRVIAYYGDDLAKIEGLLREIFEIDEDNSRKASDALGAQQFGYLSNHFIVGIDAARAQLVEWRAHAGRRAEIQVRTAAQHAWATMDHKMFYKATTEMPRSIARRMAILSALFELADEQFQGLRQEREKLEVEYGENLRSKIRSVTPLDASAMDALLLASDLPTVIDEYLTDKFGFSAHTPSSMEPLSRASDDYRNSNFAEDRSMALHLLQELGYEDAESVMQDFLQDQGRLREALGILDDVYMTSGLGSVTYFDVLSHIVLLFSNGDPGIISDFPGYQDGMRRAQAMLADRSTKGVTPIVAVDSPAASAE